MSMTAEDPTQGGTRTPPVEKLDEEAVDASGGVKESGPIPFSRSVRVIYSLIRTDMPLSSSFKTTNT